MAFDLEVVGVPVLSDVVGDGGDLDEETILEVAGRDPVGGDDLGLGVLAVVGGLHDVGVGGGVVTTVTVPADAAVPATAGGAVVAGGGGGTDVLLVDEAADVVLLADLGFEDGLLLGVEDLEADLVVGFLGIVLVVHVGDLERELALVPVGFKFHLGGGGDGAGGLGRGVGAYVPGHVAVVALDLAGAEVVNVGGAVAVGERAPVPAGPVPDAVFGDGFLSVEVGVVDVVDESVTAVDLVEGVDGEGGLLEDDIGRFHLAGGVGAVRGAVFFDGALLHGLLEGEGLLGSFALPNVAVVLAGASANPADRLGEVAEFADGAHGRGLVLGGEGSRHGGRLVFTVGLGGLCVDVVVMVAPRAARIVVGAVSVAVELAATGRTVDDATADEVLLDIGVLDLVGELVGAGRTVAVAVAVADARVLLVEEGLHPLWHHR